MKHVFLDDFYDQGHILMRDLENHADCYVIYRDRLRKNRIKNRILRSWKFKCVLDKLKKELWRIVLFGKYCNDETQSITMITAWYSSELVSFFRCHYPKAKLVLIIRDTVNDNTLRNKQFDIEKAKREFDLVLSYDNNHDVPLYGLKYAPVFISKFDEMDHYNRECKYDISFIGGAKDRIENLHKIYQYLEGNGIRSFFYIYRSHLPAQLTLSGIVYGDKYMDRFEVLKTDVQSNCILEVLKGDAHSNTLRFWEAVLYNKKFYTNCKEIVKSPYYNPNYVKVFKNPEDIDLNFISERTKVNYGYKGDLSPITLLEMYKNANLIFDR